MTSAPPAAAAGRAALGSLWGNRPFRRLWLSNVFFFGGVWTQSLVLGWLAFEATRSEFLVAVLALLAARVPALPAFSGRRPG